MSEAADVQSDALRGRVVSGIAWKAASQIILQCSRLIVALILARMLTPHDWGLAAMTLVFSGFVVVFTDNALGTALIQRRDLTDRDRSTVFWTSAMIGTVLAALGIALSGPLARFYGEPDVQPLFSVLAISFCATGLGTTQGALLVREMRFRSLESRQIIATLSGAAVGIGVAVGGGGAWAIVAQYVTDATLFSALLWYRTSWHPTLSFSWASLRKLSGFAGNVFAENVLYQGGRNLGSLLIGRFLGAAALGAYAIASNVILVPFSRLAAPLQQVFFPAFSSMQNDRGRMADVWIRVTRLVGALAFPALVGLVIVATDFVSVVLGPRWEDAAPIIQILAWAGLVQSLQTLNGEILLALGRAGTLFRFTVLWFAGTVVAFAVGVQWGVLGVAACYTAVIVLIEPLRTYLATKALQISIWRFIGAFTGVAQATAVMSVAVIATRQLLIAHDVPAGVRLLAAIAVGVAVYIPVCAWRSPEVVEELGRFLPRRGRRTHAMLGATAPDGE
jgi:O-antigen/teichoic acid export membrane protein